MTPRPSVLQGLEADVADSLDYMRSVNDALMTINMVQRINGEGLPDARDELTTYVYDAARRLLVSVTALRFYTKFRGL